MKKHRFLAIIITVVTLVSLASCGSTESSEKPANAVPDTTTAAVTTTTTAKEETSSQSEELTNDEKWALKDANSHAKTAYNAVAEYLADKETEEGIRSVELVKEEFFGKGTTTGIDLSADVPSAEGAAVVYKAMKENRIQSGLVLVSRFEIDVIDTFCVQYKSSEDSRIIGQYPDAITVADALKVKWGTHYPEEATFGGAINDTASTTTVKEEEPKAEENSDSLKDRNGFDTNKNWTYKFDGLSYSIPNYFEQEENKFLTKDSKGVANLVFGSLANDTAIDVDENFFKYFLSLSEDYTGGNDISSMTVAGLKAYYGSITGNDNKTFGILVLIDNKEQKSIDSVFFVQTKAEFEYFSDFERIINSAKIVKSNKSEKKNSSPISVTNTYISKDYSGNAVLVVEYKWTNYADYEAYFTLLFNDKVYQNGVECNTAYFCDDVDSQALLTSVQPGATFTIKEAYTLRDSSQVQITVGPLLSFTNEKYIDMKVNIK